MAERRDGPRILHEPDPPPADANASVDVADLLERLADLTAELADASVRQKHAEAKLKTKAAELESEREAHDEAVRRLEADCGELEAVLAGQRDARAATEADLKRAKERGAAVHHQLRVVQAQLGQDKPQGPPPWWRRFGP